MSLLRPVFAPSFQQPFVSLSGKEKPRSTNGTAVLPSVSCQGVDVGPRRQKMAIHFAQFYQVEQQTHTNSFFKDCVAVLSGSYSCLEVAGMILELHHSVIRRVNRNDWCVETAVEQCNQPPSSKSLSTIAAKRLKLIRSLTCFFFGTKLFSCCCFVKSNRPLSTFGLGVSSHYFHRAKLITLYLEQKMCHSECSFET